MLHEKHSEGAESTAWLVIFAGINFREIGQNSNFKIFVVVISKIGESGTCSDCFRSRLCITVWIVRLCLRSILDSFSDSLQRHTRWHAFVGCCIEIGRVLKTRFVCFTRRQQNFCGFNFCEWLLTCEKRENKYLAKIPNHTVYTAEFNWLWSH